MIVDDDGPGFPPGVVDAPFRELTTTKTDGIGLGLYVSERLMRASGGALRLSNRATGGARVELAMQRFEPA